MSNCVNIQRKTKKHVSVQITKALFKVCTLQCCYRWIGTLLWSCLVMKPIVSCFLLSLFFMLCYLIIFFLLNKTIRPFLKQYLTLIGEVLTHFQPMFHFCTPLKTSENRRFSDAFRGYRSGTLVENELNTCWKHEWYFTKSLTH